MTGTLRENQHTLFIISHSVLFRMKNVSDKGVEKIKNTNLCSNTPFRKSRRL